MDDNINGGVRGRDVTPNNGGVTPNNGGVRGRDVNANFNGL
jgi:hypothetical protein